MKLANVDLNLLKVFRAVDETRHVTRAARALGMSQSALSHSLRRMRALFDDALFIKTPRGMVPTTLAQGLSQPIRDALAAIERDVLDRAPFRPDELTRTFVIRATDYTESLFAPRLLTRLGKEAPRVRFAVTPAPLALPLRELESGACDLAIGGFLGNLPDGVRHEPFVEDVFACAVRRDHPRIRTKRVTLDAFCQERHLLVAPGGELSGRIDRALAGTGRSREVVAGTSAFLIGGWMTCESDCIITSPSKVLAVLARRLPLTIFAPPLELAPIRVVLAWHARNDADPGHRWFRSALRASV